MGCRNARSRSVSALRRARWKSMWPTACGFVPSECSPGAVKNGSRTRQRLRPVGREYPMNSNDAEIEAGEWLARLDRGDATSADFSAFDRWQAADVRHAAAYARL